MVDTVKLTQIQKLFEDEAFVARFNVIEDVAEVKKLFADNTVELTDEEITDFLTAVVKGGEQKQTGELSAEEMENVVGGSWTAALIIGGVCAVVSGTCMYKLRKLLGV